MSKYDVETSGEAWEAVRRELRVLLDLAKEERVSLTEFASRYERATKAVLSAADSHGLSSSRFRAAAKSLDLKTPRSQLDAFLQEAPVAPLSHGPTDVNQ